MGHITAKLRQKGYRITPQRSGILDIIENTHDHISAEDIYLQVKTLFPELNLSTVYRTMELLTSLGMVTQTDLGDGCQRYHCIRKGQHHHLICRSCGKITDVETSALDPLIENLKKEYGFTAEMHHMAIFGYCAECALRASRK